MGSHDIAIRPHRSRPLLGALCILWGLLLTSAPMPVAASGLFEMEYPEGAEVRIETAPPVDFDVSLAPWKEVAGVPQVRYAQYQEFMLIAFRGAGREAVTTSELSEPPRHLFDWPGRSLKLSKPVAISFPNHNLIQELRVSSAKDGTLKLVLESLVPLPMQEMGMLPDDWRIFWIGTSFEIRMQRTIAPHVVYLKRVMADASGQRRVHLVRANLATSGFEPHLSYPADVGHKRASVGTLMKSINGYVAINGGYFDGAGRSQGLLVRDGYLNNKPIMLRPSFAMNHEGIMAIGYLPVIGTISGLRSEVNFEHINGHFDGNNIVLLSPGHPSRLADETRLANAWKVVIDNDIVRRVGFEPLTQEERQVAHVLLVPPTLAYSANFAPGEQIRARYQVGRTGSSAIDLALQAGPMLVRNGAPDVSTQGDFPADIRRGRAPRSALGLSQDGRTLFLMAVDGRSKSAAGATLNELAHYLVEAGAWTAMNLDGGSSTQMVVAGDLVTQNPAGAKPVANALVLVDRHGRYGRQETFF